MADISKIEGYNLKDEVARKPILTSITTSANIQHFEDGGDNIPLNSCNVEIKAQQDLHGYSNPWAGDSGKNKLPFYTNDEVSGITYTVSSKGVITATGQATGNSRIAQYLYLPAGNYVLSGCSNNSSSGVGDMYVTRVSDGVVLARDYTNIDDANRKFTLTEETRLYVAVRFSNVAFAQSATKTFYPQIEVGTSATTYEPYANVCPITGFSSIDVIRQGKNILDSSICNRNYTSPYTYFRFGGTSSTPVDGSLYLATGTYTFSISTTAYVIRALDKDNQSIEYVNNDNKLTFTLTESQKCMINIAVSGDVQISDFTYQLELNDEATTYEAYKGTTYTIPLGQTIYGGTTEIVGGNGTKTHNYITLNGSEDWTEFASGKYYAVVVPVNDNKVSNTGYLSNLYLFEGSGASRSTDITVDKRFYMQRQYGRVWLYDSSITSLTDLQTLLSNNNLSIVYPLETPTAFTFTGVNIPTVSGVNNIYANSGNVNALEYFNDKADYFADLDRAIDYHKYSTVEHIVGKWIDGSVLYEKTFQCTVPDSGTRSVDTGILSSATVIEIRGVAIGNTDIFSIPCYLSATTTMDINISKMNSTLELNITTTGSWSGLAIDAYVTLRYTKGV